MPVMSFPVTTSLSAEACEYRYEAFGNRDGCPARAITPAMNGEDALVPPITSQPGSPLSVSYTAGPVCGSASAATSATIRPGQLGSLCQAGLSIHAEQPAPAPYHADSV